MNDLALEEIIQKLDEELKLLKSQAQNIIVFTEKAAGTCWFALLEIRKLIIKNGFQNQEEEIYFFKQIKPEVFSKYLYYYKLFEIESHRHNASKKYQIKILNQILKDLHKFLEDNRQFCQYHWGDKKYLDNLYFVREKSNYRIHFNNICALNDYKFSTAHDNTVAAIIAYEKLIEYIDKEIDVLKYGNSKNTNTVDRQPYKSNAKWTGSFTSLVELLYALYSAKVINNGNIEIKELVEIFETMFNTKLDGYYRTFSDIKSREKSKTKFLDELKQALIRRIEDASS